MISNKFSSDRLRETLEEPASYTDLFVLCGEFNTLMMSNSIDIIEQKLEQLHAPRTTISKTKLLSVEIIQNIIRHQKKHAQMRPYFLVSMTEEGLRMKSGNSVSAADFDLLQQSLSDYENLTREALKEIYVRKLGEGKLTPEGGAGLGILTIFIRSDKHTQYDLHKVSDNEYHFCIEVDLKHAS
jgi:hypothetical protein